MSSTILPFFIRNKGRELILLVLSVIFSIILAEVFLRQFCPQIDERKKMFQFDPYLGWRFIPNKKGAVVYGGAPNFIRTNSSGFRDKEPPSDNEKISKILVLGDSFVVNVSVKDDQVFTEIMEQHLYRTAVLNFGVNGYGQVQEYLLLKKWFDKIMPELVILVIYIGNDFEDNIGRLGRYTRPFASIDGEDSTLRINLPSPSASPSKDPTSMSLYPFWKRSHLYLLVKEGLSLLTTKFSQIEQTKDRPPLPPPKELCLCQIEPTADTQYKYRIMNELLRMIAHYLDERKTPVVFALAPTFLQVYDKQWSSVLLECGEISENYKKSLPNEKLMQFAEQNNLFMIDLLPILQSETNKGKQLYNLKEHHWNSAGNRVVAYALLDYLKNKLFIKPEHIR